MRFLQLNLNHCEAAQDLCWQTVSELDIDVALLSEQYRDVEGSCCWMTDLTGRAAIWVKRGHFVQEVQPTKRKGFVWLKVGNIFVCSVYAPPSDSQVEFEALMDNIVQELRSRHPLLIAGDFNAWATEWGSRETNARGECLLDIFSALDVVLLNTGSTPTFSRNGRSSFIDLTCTSASFVCHVTNWYVSDKFTYSDHQAIFYEVVATNTRRKKGKSQLATWNHRSFDRDSFITMLEEKITFLGTAEEKASQLMEFITDACDASMTKCFRGRHNVAVYWWNEEIANLRRACLRTRRLAQRARDHPSVEVRRQEHRDAKRILARAIKKSKRESWMKLCEEVEEDPWGRPYKVTMARLKSTSFSPPTSPDMLERIVSTLFPKQTEMISREGPLSDMDQVPEVDQVELDLACEKIGEAKAPGPDNVPNVALKVAIRSRPELFLDVYNTCLREGTFPSQWKKQHLVLIPKGKGNPSDPSFYRPICLLDTAGKVLERILSGRLTEHIERVQGLSDNQYGFRKRRSTIDAIARVIKSAREAIAGKRWRRGGKKYCAIITLDVKNAFNSACWGRIMEGLRKMEVPHYIMRIIQSYFSERILSYGTDKGSESYKVSGGVPQGSVLGPLLWNVMYDEVLRLPLPEETTTIGFADDLVIVVCGKLLEEITYKANKAVATVRQWISSAGLHLADHKTEALLVTSRKVRETISLTVGNIDIQSQSSLRYLGVQIDARLRFDEHLRIVSCKAARVTNALARIMPNIGGPGQNRRKLLATVSSSILLYAAPIWKSAMLVQSYARKANSVYRRSALRVTRAFRTVSYDAVCVVASMPPIDLLAEERDRIHRRRREELDLPWQTITKEERLNTLCKWQSRWDASSAGRWTHRMIPDIGKWWERKHGKVDHYLTQLLTNHGCFRAYLARFKIEEVPSCPHCIHLDETAEHAFFLCPRYSVEKNELDRRLGQTAVPENLVGLMLVGEDNWKAVEEYAALIGKKLRAQERERRGLGVMHRT